MSALPLQSLLRTIGIRPSLVDARFDFADSLADVCAPQVGDVVEQISEARSLDELWQFRTAIFSLVARQHHEGEARRRLKALARHAPPRRRVLASPETTAHAAF
ncbi:hypothetical protein [Piscinibacter koreensis]|uniref:Uncharacterized protein n=1 Tax=Piscinibacter koreensis TaxID=2742824 RepID=A0A7Y6NR43_9BURK|nr:hypothetical protein [Schlegelella koreensis]NUZ07793.1 hypothetical protein [Schlegelella koreensis]